MGLSPEPTGKRTKRNLLCIKKGGHNRIDTMGLQESQRGQKIVGPEWIIWGQITWAQWVEKENRVLLGWYSIDGFTGFGGSSTGPVWFLCRDCSCWRGSSLRTEVCGWAILEVSGNPQKVSPPGGGRILTEYPDQISGLEGGSWDC